MSHKRHQNNAIIITSVQGERGPQGFVGPAGQSCYTGTAKWQNITKANGNVISAYYPYPVPTYPTYNDPSDFVRGEETFYFQDETTGQIWETRGKDGYFYHPVTGDKDIPWKLTTINIKGAKGQKGADAYNKVEVNLGTNNAPYQDFLLPAFPGSTLNEEVCRVIFPGTSVASFSTVKVVVKTIGGSATLNIRLLDSSGATIASGTTSNDDIKTSIVTLTVSGTFPTNEDYLVLEFDGATAPIGRQMVRAAFYYLIIE